MTDFAKTSLQVIALGLGIGAIAPSARGQQLPEGGHSDCAAFIYDGDHLSVFQSHESCIIDWESFSIGQGAVVHFIQESHWRSLNRVTGGAFSNIVGTLRADGTVYISNPAGIVFAAGSIVDAGSIYATAGSISDADFHARIDRFTTLQGTVINDGVITADAVHLSGRKVVNNGVIRAVNGVATLTAAENEVMLLDDGGRILVRVDGALLDPDAPQSGGPAAGGAGIGVENNGTIEATNGQVILGVGDMYALAIRNRGRIDARGGTAQLAAVSGTVASTTAGAAIAANDLSMSGDTLLLGGTIDADVANFRDPTVISDTLDIHGASGGTAAAIVFHATVDGATDGEGALSIDAASTVFAAGVGQTTRLHSMSATGGVDAYGDVAVADGISSGGTLGLWSPGHQVIDAGDGTLDVAGDVIKSVPGDAILRSTGAVEIGGSFTSSGGDATIESATAVVHGSVSAAVDANFTGDAVIDGNVLAGDDVEFLGAAQVGGVVQAQDDARFAGDAWVAGGVFAGDDALFAGDAAVGMIITGGDVRVDGDAVVAGAVSAGDDARFFGNATVAGPISVADDLEIHGAAQVGGSLIAGSDIDLLGGGSVAGSVQAADDLRTLGSIDIGGSILAGDDVTLGGHTSVGSTLTASGVVTTGGDLTTGGAVTVGQGLTVGGRAQLGGDVVAGLDAEFVGDASIDGNVHAGRDLRFLARATVHGTASADDDARFFGVSQIDGSIVVRDDIELGDHATVGGSLLAGDDIRAQSLAIGGDILADDNITLDGPVSMTGAGARTIASAGGETRVFGSIEKLTAGQLSISGEEGIVIDAASIVVRDDLILGAGRDSVPTVATISVLGNTRLVSSAGAISIADGEKITAFGDLTIVANDSVTLGDANVLGDFSITAAAILLRTRDAGDVLLASGLLVRDQGLDLAAGRFLFSVRPTLLGSGDVLFGSPHADADVLGTLDAYRLRVLSDFDADGLRFDDRALDLVVDGGVATELGIAFDERPEVDPVRPTDETRTPAEFQVDPFRPSG